jgi:hypothetical protein
MDAEGDKGNPAEAVGQKNSERQRGEAGTNQHEGIDYVLHSFAFGLFPEIFNELLLSMRFTVKARFQSTMPLLQKMWPH